MGGVQAVSDTKNWASLIRLLLALVGEMVWLVHVAVGRVFPQWLAEKDRLRPTAHDFGAHFLELATLLANLRVTLYRLFRKRFPLTHSTTGILGMTAAVFVMVKIGIERDQAMKRKAAAKALKLD